MIVGDSQLSRVNESKFINDHTVEKRFKPGLKLKEVASLAGKSCSDVIIIHAGTNSISNSSPEEFGRDVVETLMKVHENNPKARIGFSTIFRRNEDLNLKAKVAKVNKVVEDELAINGVDTIYNSNTFFSNLWNDATVCVSITLG